MQQDSLDLLDSLVDPARMVFPVPWVTPGLLEREEPPGCPASPGDQGASARQVSEAARELPAAEDSPEALVELGSLVHKASRVHPDHPVQLVSLDLQDWEVCQVSVKLIKCIVN